MTTTDLGPTDFDENNALGELGRHWGVVLVIGLSSLVVGILAIAWPGKTTVVVAVLFAAWLIVTGIFQIVRGFGRGLSGGMRALMFIGGALSLILGLLAVRSIFQAVEILGIFVGIAFLFRGFGALFMGFEQKAGRGWNIFLGIIMLLGGLVVLAYPMTTIAMLTWVVGLWLIVGGIFEIIGAFKLRSYNKSLA
jgi:uncharacterized membrane protein HdeD (DUF308 family)